MPRLHLSLDITIFRYNLCAVSSSVMTPYNKCIEILISAVTNGAFLKPLFLINYNVISGQKMPSDNFPLVKSIIEASSNCYERKTRKYKPLETRRASRHTTWVSENIRWCILSPNANVMPSSTEPWRESLKIHICHLMTRDVNSLTSGLIVSSFSLTDKCGKSANLMPLLNSL